MANCSPDVLWAMVRDQSCHLQKRRASLRSGMGKKGGHFTLEPNNLMGINSYKYSGIANAKTVGIAPVAEGKGIVLTTKSKKSDRIRKVRPSAALPPGQPPWLRYALLPASPVR